MAIALVTTQSQPDFKTWKEQNKKTYPNAAEEAAAKKTYDNNAAKITKHNSNPKSAYKQKVHSKSDKTDEELKKEKSGPVSFQDANKVEPKKQKSVKSSGAATKASWSEKINKSNKEKDSKDQASIPASLDYSRWYFDFNGKSD